MQTNKESNLFHLELVAQNLGDLLPQVTFVGGSITLLLVDEAAHFGVRKTDDVDVVIDVATLSEYHKFSSRLRKRGFKEDQDGPNCRWKLINDFGQIKLDVVPVNKNILGFSNPWYKDAIDKADIVQLNNGNVLRVISPDYFIATKFEAFQDRGAGNYFNHDLEDIFFIMENRNDLMLLLESCEDNLKAFLSMKFKSLMNDDFYNVLPGLLNNPDSSVMIRRYIEVISSWY